MLVSRCTRKLCGLLKKQTKLCYNQNRTGYIVLLPEVDTELAEKLLTAHENLPAFSKLSTEKLGTLMGKQILDYECQVRNMESRLEESPHLYPDLFEDILDPLEKITCTFDTVWGLIKTLYLVDKNLVPPAAYFTLVNRVCAARSSRFQQELIYDACRKIDKSKLSEEQARLIDKHISEGSLSALDAKPTYRAVYFEKSSKLTEKQYHFRIRVEAARAQFYLTISDETLVRDFPKKLLQQTSKEGGGSIEGPWTIKLNYNIAEQFMEYCPDRDMRWLVWSAEDKAATLTEENRELNNSLNLEEVRYLRYELALLAGHKNYYAAHLSSKMAGTLENIQSTLDAYLQAAKPAQLEEVLELQEFTKTRNFTYPIQLWDIAYWSRKYKQAAFNFDDDKMRNYLPLEKVLKGLFDLCSRLFNIRIQEVKNMDVWHPDVRFYYIYEEDNEKPTSGFYFDPYERSSKMPMYTESATVIPIRSASRIPRPVLPLSAIVLDLPRPEANKPTLLSFSDMKGLFSTFGHNLQFLLCKSSYADISGSTFMEYDAVNVCRNFMENWVYNKNVFDSIQGHYETGEKLKDVDLLGVRNHLSAFRICQELYKSNLDIKLHTETNKYWMDISDELWDDYFVFPRSRFHSDPLRYLDIFCGYWGAAYYSFLWSEMLAADIYQAFSEENADIANLGARFRDTYLTFGGSCHASEVFRRFRGRDPNTRALLNHYGIVLQTEPDSKNKESSENPDVVVTC